MRSRDGKRILVVDDNPAGLYAKSRVLRRAGFEVIEASNGEDALRLVLEAAPSLVLLDVQLPDINGLEVCRRIKTSPITRHLPVLHISATYAADEIQAISAESGADIYLVEPIGPEELITVVRTLLRLRSTEMILADSEVRLRLAIEQAEIATWDIELDSGVAAFSPRMYELLGCSATTGPPTSLVWLDRIHPDDRAKVESALGTAWKEGILFQCEHRIRRADTGEERWLAPLGNVQSDERGEKARVIGVVMDVTARKRIETRRDALLEREYSARTEAETAARLKDEFLATLSHELRNPMSAVLGWLQLLRSGRLDPAQTQQALETIDRNARLQNKLINDMLDVSRIITGRLRLDFAPVAARPVLESALASVKPLADDCQVTIAPQLPAPDVKLNADASRLQQVFVNVVTNAIKYSKPGGRITVASSADEERLRVIVTDDGEGIAAESLPHIFELFRQADGSITRSHGGLGLGLAIVRHLLELHGGTVRAESEGIGKGTSIIMDIPRLSATVQVDVPHPARGETSPASTESLIGVGVLVVDDDSTAVELVRRMLLLEGSRVACASNADEAQALYSADNGIDVLISDIGMPRRDGYDLVRRLRMESAGHRRLVAVAVSGYARREDVDLALEAGFDLHVSKPFDIKELTASIAELLSLRNASSDL